MNNKHYVVTSLKDAFYPHPFRILSAYPFRGSAPSASAF